jgi:hypothetical protein
MPDDVSADVDSRSIDDIITKMIAQQQQQNPHLQHEPLPSRPPRGFFGQQERDAILAQRQSLGPKYVPKVDEGPD